MSDWDATRYHRISEPQFDWGQQVIARLRPAAGERILDLGCGTGRLTQELATSAGNGQASRVVGLDRSGAMLAVARAGAAVDVPRPIRYVQGDGAALPFEHAFDAVFSAATLHWIHDHDAVFRGVAVALVPGGRFVAQCGGHRNLERMLDHAAVIMTEDPYRASFDGWRSPWNFADAESTAARLERAGLTSVHAWIEPSPVDLGDADRYAEFVSVVCIRHHLDRLPVHLRAPFTRALTARAAADPAPFTLDYWRLNIDARKPA